MLDFLKGPVETFQEFLVLSGRAFRNIFRSPHYADDILLQMDAIGVIIFVGQWKDFLGLTPAASCLRFHQKLWALIEALPTVNLATTGLALLSLAILISGARSVNQS